MVEQVILEAQEDYSELDAYLKDQGIRKCLLVCGGSLGLLRIGGYFESVEERLGIEIVKFSEFQPNPSYDSVAAGVKVFRAEQCDLIIAVGGGSAIDVAKCIKLFSNMDPDENYLQQKPVPNRVRLLAVPTTAGTGSEATRYAVIYYNGEKQSVSDVSCIPAAVLMDVSALRTLPAYQRKATMLDALCHGIESYWSLHSTEESRRYSGRAIRMIMANWRQYLDNEEDGNVNMLHAANLAGKAINITQTTAGHAMCYKLTSLYGIAHGHAAALCLAQLWKYMLKHTDRCIDPRGEEYLRGVLREIAAAMGCDSPERASEMYAGLLSGLELAVPAAREEDFAVLRASVNPVRLKNHPVFLDDAAIDELYHHILCHDIEVQVTPQA